MDKQTILITGATGNVVAGAAIALARRETRVVLLGRRLDSLEYKANSNRVVLSQERRDQQETDIGVLDVVIVTFEDITERKRFE